MMVINLSTVPLPEIARLVSKSEEDRATWLPFWEVIDVHTIRVHPEMYLCTTTFHRTDDPMIVRTQQSLYLYRASTLVRVRAITDWTESLNPEEVI
jgi:hypothetical protein